MLIITFGFTGLFLVLLRPILKVKYGFLSILSYLFSPLSIVPMTIFLSYKFVSKIGYGLVTCLVGEGGILIALFFLSVLIWYLHGFREPLLVVFSYTYIRTLIPALILMLIFKPIVTRFTVEDLNTFFTNPIGVIIGKVEGPAKIAFAIVIVFLAIFLMYFFGLLAIARIGKPKSIRSSRRRGSRNAWLESWPPIKCNVFDFDLGVIPIYVKQSDLRISAYTVFRVEGKKEADLSRIVSALDHVNKLIFYLDEEGTLTLYIINRGKNLNSVIKNIINTLKMLRDTLTLKPLSDSLKLQNYILRSISPFDIPSSYTYKPERGGLVHPFGPEETIGRALVLQSGEVVSEGGVSYRTRIGIWDLSGKLSVGQRRRHVSELTAKTLVDDDKVFVLVFDALSRAHPIVEDEYGDKISPLMLRRGHKYINKPIKIPLKYHIGICGSTGTGKSTAIANIIEYVNKRKLGKILVLDWIGNFINVSDASVYYPGEDIYVDLYGGFTRDEILELYEEALILSVGEEERLTPAVRGIIRRAIYNANSHRELMEILEKELNLAGRPETRDLLLATINRLQPLKPEHYSPIEGGVDIVKALNKDDLVIINLSELESRTDQTLFAMACLRYIMKTWTSKNRLFIFIDEARRLAPEIRWRKELILEFLARESRKYNITLILATQRLSSLKREVIANLPTLFIFNVQDDDDIKILTRRFSSWLINTGLTMSDLEGYTSKKLSELRIGECYLISREYDGEPIPCYFKKYNLKQYEPLNIKKFNEVIEKFNWPERIKTEHKEKAIINAKKLIRKHGESIINKILANIGEIDYLEIDGITVIRDGKLTYTSKIILNYYGYEYEDHQI